ncbi:uncharacterized protein LOC109792278 [Cajanus cajan]|uniref:uncharacterized protein LOC109792278 n=1 Tax=Cajanus cajan TaxID=3821 RepID=UPI00098DC7F1|nr:uncharacterized protein LOC109792278 [Cajanus cajan]
MPRTRRHVVARCRSTPNEENNSSMGTHQSVEVQLPQSEPMPNIESSSQDDIHATSPTCTGSRRSTHHESDVVEDSSVAQKKSPTYWNVNVINEEGVVRQTRLRVQDVFASRDATKVCTKWNAEGQPIGEYVGLLAGFLGEIAKFDVNDQEHKKYILANLGKKWRDTRCRLFHKNYNWKISVEENCQMHPPDIDQDHWRLFVQFRTSPKQMEISDKNVANREKLLIPHTLGSKTLARKKDELETSSENEAFLKVFRKGHPGYVRGMELGVTLTQIIGSYSSSTRSGSSSDAATIAQL